MYDAFKEDGCMFTNTDLICKSYKELKKNSETAYFEGSCKIIKQEDLKF